MTRQARWIVIAGLLAGAVAIGLAIHVKRSRSAHLHSWYLLVTPTGRETRVTQVDMRWSRERQVRVISEALDPIFDNLPARFDRETVLGTCQWQWSNTEPYPEAERLYREKVPGFSGTATFSEKVTLHEVSIVAGRAGESTWALMEVVDGKLSPVAACRDDPPEEVKDMICDYLRYDMVVNCEVLRLPIRDALRTPVRAESTGAP